MISIDNQSYISQSEKIIIHFWTIKWLYKILFFYFFKEPYKKNNFQYLINKNHILMLLYCFRYEIYN